MPKPVRVVVTGHDETDKSTIKSDGPSPSVFTFVPGMHTTDIWKTAQTPVVLTRSADSLCEGPFKLDPPAGGSVFRIMELGPEAEQEKISPQELYARLGNSDFAAKDLDLAHPLMHKTNSVDFCIVLQGTITLITDTGETDLQVGDVVVQLGCNHMWVNRGSETCRVAFVMVPSRLDL